jgi:hypothetical protein
MRGGLSPRAFFFSVRNFKLYLNLNQIRHEDPFNFN